ncbi:MAG: hypothetical protein ABWY55_09790 [Microbacterium sp.]
MDYSILTMADQLEKQRASALARENELRRSVVDRGNVITPARPVVDMLHGLGAWLRLAQPAPRTLAAH